APVLLEGSSLDPYKDRATLRSSADPAIRRQAFQSLYDGLQKNRTLVAFALNRLTVVGNARAKAHHFTDAAEEAYASMFLTKTDVRNLLGQIASTSDTYKDLERERAQRIAKALGLSEVHAWDLSAPLPDAAPQFSFDEARAALLAALAPLGEAYGKEMAAL